MEIIVDASAIMAIIVKEPERDLEDKNAHI
jgi:predicted nucleic acid-binding protein